MTQIQPIYAQRREAVLQQMPENSLAFVASGEEHIRNRDVEYPFRADSDFYYLTGFEEPESVLVLLKAQSKTRSVLFLRPKDEEQEIWQGRRLGVENAEQALKVDEAFSIEEFDTEMPQLVEGMETLLFSFAQLGDWSGDLSQWIQSQKAKARRGVVAPTKMMDLDAILHAMRLIKSDDEIALIREAARVSVQGHLAAMQAVKPEGFEYQVQGALENAFRQHGSPRVGFNTIVAAGNNACVLHYTENTALIQNGDLVLVDAGAEFGSYAGDITTTFPANGRFSEPQAALYSLCLKAQQAVVDKIQPGILYDELHKTAAHIITEGLLQLRILEGSLDDALADEAYKRFFMHGTGHWLGMDVHDVGDYKIHGEWRPLEPGMVLTVEPGIYIAADAEGVEEQYRGIGIRIEDDVLVTADGHEVLTLGLPRTVAEIEAWMAQN